VSLIKKQVKEKFQNMTIRIEEGLFEQFKAYCEWLDSSQSHVVQELVKLALDKDKDYQAHLQAKSEVKTTLQSPKLQVAKTA
jgi:hypothetical protein